MLFTTTLIPGLSLLTVNVAVASAPATLASPLYLTVTGYEPALRPATLNTA